MITAEQVRARLEEFILSELCVGSATPTLEQWAELDPNIARQGWCPPVEYDGIITVAYQPDILARMARDLTHEETDTFLQAVEYLISMQIVHIDEPAGAAAHGAVAAAENMLVDEIGIEILHFLSRIQMAALES